MPLRRTKIGPYAVAIASALGFASALVACFTFDGVTVPDDPGDAGDAGTGHVPDGPNGGGGEGGADVLAPQDACAAMGKGYLSLAEAVRACRYIAECDTGQLELDIESSFGIVTSASSFAYCVNALAGEVPSDRVGLDVAQQTFQCVARATSCIQARGCLPVESLTAKDTRCAENVPKNDAGVYCANAGNDVVDCTAGVVQHCKTKTFANGACAIDPADPSYYGCGGLVGSCATEVASCDIATSVLSDCAQNTSVNDTYDCRTFGASCGPSNVDGGPPFACLTGGAYTPCDATTYRDQCVDDAIASCTYIGTVATTSCKKLGKTCSGSNGVPLCVGAEDDCSPFSLGIGVCTGSAISLCVDGKKTTFDCACAGLVCGADAGIGNNHCTTPP